MTYDYKRLCDELIDALDSGIPAGRIRMSPLANRARALLAQPVAEGPTDEELLRVAATEIVSYEISGITPGEYEPETECVVEAYGSELIAYARAALARWGRPTPQPEEADIHYAWELHDAEGEWQAGGSANSLEDVQREGNRYLQTYSQDGPHKLIIQRHCVTTIEEATSD